MSVSEPSLWQWLSFTGTGKLARTSGFSELSVDFFLLFLFFIFKLLSGYTIETVTLKDFVHLENLIPDRNT